MTTNLTAEWEYRYDERIAILCGSANPTPEQHEMAIREADEAVERLSKPAS